MRKGLILALSIVLVMAFSLGVMAAKKEVTIAGGSVGIELELTKKAAKMFEETHPNVDVKVMDTPDSTNDRLGLFLQFLEAESPKVDVYQIDVIWPGDLGEHFLDLYEYGAKDVADKHFQAIIENNTVDGRLVALPWFTDAGLLYYRTDLLKKYGYDGPPETWAELEKMAKKVQAGEREAGNQDFWGYVWQGNAYEGLTCDALEWIKSNGGGTIVNKDKEITINNEKAVEAVNMAANWVGEISPPGVTGLMEESARKMWENGNALFMRNWPYCYSTGNQEGKVINGKFDVAPLPAGDSGNGASTLGGWNLAVSKYTDTPELAVELAMFVAGEKIQKMRAIEGSFNPTIKSLYKDEEVLENSPFFGKLYDVFVNAVARPSTATAPKYAQTSELFFQAVHSVLTGEQSAETALAYLQLDLQDLLGYDVK